MSTGYKKYTVDGDEMYPVYKVKEHYDEYDTVVHFTQRELDWINRVWREWFEMQDSPKDRLDGKR